MFVKLFKSNHQVLIPILLIIGSLLWIYTFINPRLPVSPKDVEIAYKWIYSYIVEIHPVFSAILAFGLLLLQSIILNNLVINNNLNDKNTFLPALCYFVLMSVFPENCTLNNTLIINLALLVFINTFLKIYLREDAFAPIFNISFFIAVLSLFYNSAILLLVIVWSVFIIYRNNAWREWIISIIGFVLPYLFIFFYYFWVGKTGFVKEFYNGFSFNTLHPDFYSVKTLSALIIQVIIFYALIKYYSNYKDKIVMLRKYAAIIIVIFFIDLLMVYFSDSNRVVFIQMTYIPAAIFISQLFLRIKKSWVSELIFFILIGLLVINRVNLILP